MPRQSNKLTARKVSSLRTPGRHGDGAGLWLQISPEGGKSWLFRYTLNGRARMMGLGPVDLVSLTEAREQALTHRKLLLAGIDPLVHRDTERRKSRLADASAITFEEAATRYIDARKVAWKNAKHATQWQNTLETYAYPVFGELPVEALDTGLVLKALEPIWTEKPETASRVRGRIEAVVDWATARGYKQGDNPARWKGHLEKLLPARSQVRAVKHHKALPYVEVPVFFADLNLRKELSAKALAFTILTACRTSETLGARWCEFELQEKIWTIPAERMKSGKDHRVPLSAAALKILRRLPGGTGEAFVFPGSKRGNSLSNMAMLACLKRMNRNDLTVHGFRSSFRDWAAERTNVTREVAEQALAHTISDQVEAAYRRGDLFEKRRHLMGTWGSYCSTVKASSNNVVPLAKIG